MHFNRSAQVVSGGRPPLGSASGDSAGSAGGGCCSAYTPISCGRACSFGVLLLPNNSPPMWPFPGRLPQEGTALLSDPPTFEVCTCFQNLTTFLPRRTRFWSVTLRATKLRSPPWTLAPTANNLLPALGIHFSCCGASGRKLELSDTWVTRTLSPACSFPHLETYWHQLHETGPSDSGSLTREGNPLNLKLTQLQFEVWTFQLMASFLPQLLKTNLSKYGTCIASASYIPCTDTHTGFAVPSFHLMAD